MSRIPIHTPEWRNPGAGDTGAHATPKLSHDLTKGKGFTATPTQQGILVPKVLTVRTSPGTVKQGDRFTTFRLRDATGQVFELSSVHVLGVRPDPRSGVDQVSFNFTQIKPVYIEQSHDGAAGHTPPTTTVPISFEPVRPTHNPQTRSAETVPMTYDKTRWTW